MSNEKTVKKASSPPMRKGVVTTRFSSKFDFKGWGDMDCEKPKKEGEYLCLVKWVGQDEYEYTVVTFTKEEGFHLFAPKVEHVLWTQLPPMPF